MRVPWLTTREVQLGQMCSSGGRNALSKRVLDPVPAPPWRQNQGENTTRGLRRPRVGFQHALLTDAQFRDHALVALGIVGLQIVEQTTTLAHQHQQAAA